MVRVYLDQNFWIRITAARQGRADPGFSELLEACQSAVDDGRAQFVLSFANYEENWRRGSLADRIAVAETMELLSGFVTMRTVWRLHEDEVRASLCHILPVEDQERTRVFGRGIRHLLPFEPFDLFSDDFRVQLAQHGDLRVAAGLFIEHAALVGSMFEGSDVESRRPDREHHEAYMHRRTELATSLRVRATHPTLRVARARRPRRRVSHDRQDCDRSRVPIQPSSREGIESFLDSYQWGQS